MALREDAALAVEVEVAVEVEGLAAPHLHSEREIAEEAAVLLAGAMTLSAGVSPSHGHEYQEVAAL